MLWSMLDVTPCRRRSCSAPGPALLWLSARIVRHSTTCPGASCYFFHKASTRTSHPPEQASRAATNLLGYLEADRVRQIHQGYLTKSVQDGRRGNGQFRGSHPFSSIAFIRRVMKDDFVRARLPDLSGRELGRQPSLGKGVEAFARRQDCKILR